jgi:uncharacterized cupredoxin-like copper-binding protein
MNRSTLALAIPLIAVLAVPPASAAAPVARVKVVLSSHKFSPSPIYLSAGVPTRLTIANQSADAHEFKAPEFFYWSRVRGKVPGGVLRLRAGETATLTLTPRRGTYKLKCGRFGHALLGMSTTIVVN